jgi:tetratricopeptide (TPR) repeat protein
LLGRIAPQLLDPEGSRRKPAARVGARFSFLLAVASAAAPGWCQQEEMPPAPAGQAQAPATVVSLAGVLAQADALIASHRAREAQALLQRHEAEGRGEVRFNYLLGVASIDAGDAAAAIAPLERVVGVAPGNLAARLELGRALYETKALERARAVFAQMARENLPPATRKAVSEYLAAIDQDLAAAARKAAHSLVLFGDLGAGYDSNANVATSESQFLGFTLNSQYVETKSSFAEVGAGVIRKDAVTPEIRVTAVLRAARRTDFEARFIDQTIALGGVEVERTRGATTASIGVNGLFGWLVQTPHRLLYSVDGELAHRTEANYTLSASASAGVLDFRQEPLALQDVRRYLVGVARSRDKHGHAKRGGHGKAQFAGRDRPRDDLSPYGNRRAGVRVFGDWRLGRAGTWSGELAYLRTEFDGERGFFRGDRADDQYFALVRADFEDWPRRSWIVTPVLRFSAARSNIALFEYDRAEAMVFVRRLVPF